MNMFLFFLKKIVSKFFFTAHLHETDERSSYNLFFELFGLENHVGRYIEHPICTCIENIFKYVHIFSTHFKSTNIRI